MYPSRKDSSQKDKKFSPTKRVNSGFRRNHQPLPAAQRVCVANGEERDSVDQKRDTEHKPEEVDPASRHREELRRSPVGSGHFEHIHAREMVVVESQEMFSKPDTQLRDMAFVDLCCCYEAVSLSLA
jgi:hypothetical protein